MGRLGVSVVCGAGRRSHSRGMRLARGVGTGTGTENAGGKPTRTVARLTVRGVWGRGLSTLLALAFFGSRWMRMRSNVKVFRSSISPVRVGGGGLGL